MGQFLHDVFGNHFSPTNARFFTTGTALVASKEAREPFPIVPPHPSKIKNRPKLLRAWICPINNLNQNNDHKNRPHEPTFSSLVDSYLHPTSQL